MGVRKNVRNLTSTEKQNFIEAIKAVKATISPVTGRSIYDEYVLWHRNAYAQKDQSDSSTAFRRNAAHSVPAFNAWHRYYLYRFELQLQRRVPGVTIPYWDWTQDVADPSNSPIWADDFIGGNGDPNDNNIVKTGPSAAGQWTTIATNITSLTRRFGLGGLVAGLPSQTDVSIALGETPYDRSFWNITSNPSHRNRLEGFFSCKQPVRNKPTST